MPSPRKQQGHDVRYLLNSPVLTGYGRYQMDPLTLEQARVMARSGFVSAIGHAATAEYLTHLLGVEVQESRQSVRMEPGDVALVFRLVNRPPERRIHDAKELAGLPQEFACLRRIA